MSPFTVLFVDDDPGVLGSVKRITRNADFEAVFATSGREALEKLDSVPVQMVVSDHKMPGMGGTELIATVRQRFPQVIRVLFSGYADMKTLVDAINLGEVFRFIPKPWNLDEFHRIIAECRQEYERRHQNHLIEEALRQVPVPVLIVQPEVGFVTYVNEAARVWLSTEGRFPEARKISADSASVGYPLGEMDLPFRPNDDRSWPQAFLGRPATVDGVEGHWVPVELRDYPGHRRSALMWKAGLHD